MIAAATGQAASSVMDMIGVSATTFRRKEDAHEPLPDVAGHRIMGFLRVAATLRRLLDESGDAARLQDFDLNACLAQWMREELPELGGKTPAEMLRNHEGLRAVEQVLERMRGGLPARRSSCGVSPPMRRNGPQRIWPARALPAGARAGTIRAST